MRKAQNNRPILDPVKSRTIGTMISGRYRSVGLSRKYVRHSVLKYKMEQKEWFRYLGCFAHCIIREFDLGADIELEETPIAYHIKVSKKQKPM